MTRKLQGKKNNEPLTTTDPTKHNYYSKVVALGDSLGFSRDQIHHVDVLHDDWCAVYKGGYCNCDPIVKVREDK